MSAATIIICAFVALLVIFFALAIYQSWRIGRDIDEVEPKIPLHFPLDGETLMPMGALEMLMPVVSIAVCAWILFTALIFCLIDEDK